jgi:hypothetical protein
LPPLKGREKDHIREYIEEDLEDYYAKTTEAQVGDPAGTDDTDAEGDPV